MKNIQIYADRIAGTVDRYAHQPQNQMKQFLHLLGEEGLDTAQPILYGYEAVRGIFWFRNDAKGAMISLPLQKVKVWPDPMMAGILRG